LPNIFKLNQYIGYSAKQLLFILLQFFIVHSTFLHQMRIMFSSGVCYFPPHTLTFVFLFQKSSTAKESKARTKKKKKQRNSTAIIEICASHRLQLRRQLHIFIYADIFQYIFKLPSQSAPTKIEKRGENI